MRRPKSALLLFVIIVFYLISNCYGADTVGEGADIISKAIDGKSLDELLNSSDIKEVLSGMKYMETVKLLRQSHLNELKIKKLSSDIELFKNSAASGFLMGTPNILCSSPFEF